MPDGPFADEPATTREAIMRATYHALREHGYAALTIQRIGDEFEKSKSLLYHHYDGKDALLVDFMEYLLERFEADVTLDEHDDAHDRLLALVDQVYPATTSPARHDLVAALVELRAQAAHDEAFRSAFARSDRYFRERLRRVVRAGVEEGTFDDVDPDAAAEFLFSTLHGAMVRRVTDDDPGTAPAVRAEIDAYVRTRLLATDG